MLHLKSFLFLSLVLCSIALPCPALPCPFPSLAHFISCLSAKPTINPIVHVALYLPTYLPTFSIKFGKERKGKGEVAMCPEELKMKMKLKEMK